MDLITTRGPGGELKLPSVGPGGARPPNVFGAFCICGLTMKSCERLALLAGTGRTRPPNKHFDLNIKSLAMTMPEF